MRDLLILRHAKSDWDADYPEDHERPLNRRGVRAAKRIGRHLAKTENVPELALSSSAVRARTTVELAAEAGGWRCEVEIRGGLYGASGEGWLQEIADVPSDVERLLVAGHEPTCSAVVHRLTGARARMPTAAVACVRLPASGWRETGSRGGELQWLIMPKILRKRSR